MYKESTLIGQAELDGDRITMFTVQPQWRDVYKRQLYNKELITLAAKKSGLTEEAIAASENQRSGSLIYSLYMMGNTMPLADQVYICLLYTSRCV